jgi:hypothetical protein
MFVQFKEYLLAVFSMAGVGGQRGRFATTRRNLAGIIPGWDKAGDAVGILYGCKVPFMLRKCSQSRNEFRILGECNIDGIMYGEGFSSEVIEERDIQIR